MKVFLGGTVNGSKWRDYVMSKLEIDYFNPVVDDWNEEAYQRELYERQNCDFCLYVLSPKMEGFYSIAEVTDDSFKKPDKTLFCFINEDDGLSFNPSQKKSLEQLGKQVVDNGGAWYSSLDETISVLNSANLLRDTLKEKDTLNNVFISYGRRHSLDFAKKLHDRLKSEDLGVWFDMNDIPLGVDFQEQIDQGIEKADNFVFVISPHSVKSIYCRKEIELAVKYNKRIIPLLHVYPTDCEDKMHPVIQKFNWIYFEEEKNDFEVSVTGLIQLVNSQKKYVRMHTVLLGKALEWERRQFNMDYLLVDKERFTAQEWLSISEFFDKKGQQVQAPCIPTDLHCDFITESKENAELGLTDVFISYETHNKEFKKKLVKALSRYSITAWTNDRDIKTGTDFEHAIIQGIEKTDSLIFVLSKDSIQSHYCLLELKYALEYNKRIIPLLFEALKPEEIPQEIRMLQYVNFANIQEKIEVNTLSHDNIKLEVEQRKSRSDFDKRIAELIIELNKDKQHYANHKEFLVQALTWKSQNHSSSMLLRGYRLEQSKTWFKLAQKHEHKPLPLHEELIIESEKEANRITTDVYLCYIKADGDFAYKLNNSLQMAGKITWFDHNYIPADMNAMEEKMNGILAADNMLLVVSPESIKSPHIQMEIEHAVRNSKRIVVVLNKLVAKDELPNEIKSMQWIDFVKNAFSQAFSEVIRILDVDREHVHTHSKWNSEALEWINSGKSSDQLIRGVELEIARKWAKDAIEMKKVPPPTPIQISFFDESYKAVLAVERKKKRWAILLRMMLIFTSLLFVVAFIFGILALKQKKIAEQKEIEAKQNAYEALLNKIKADSSAEVAKLSAENARKSEIIARESAYKAQKYAEEVEKKNAQLENSRREIEKQRDSIKKQEGTLQENFTNLKRQKSIIDLLFAKNQKNHLMAISRNLSVKSLQFALDEKNDLSVQYALYAHYLNRLIDGPVQNSDNYDALRKSYELVYVNENADVFALHQFPIRKVCYNKTLNIIATADDGGYIMLWEHGKLNKSINVLNAKDRIRTLAFSDNGKYLMAGTVSGNVLVWAFRNVDIKLIVNQKFTSAIKFLGMYQATAEQNYLVIGTARSIVVRSLNLDAITPSFEKPFSSVNAVSLTSDGKFICVGVGNEIQTFSMDFVAKKMEQIQSIILEGSDAISVLTISKSNKTLAVGTKDADIWLLNIGTLNGQNNLVVDTKFTEHISEITALEFDNKSEILASASLDRTVKLWRLQNLDEDRLLITGTNKWIWHIAFIEDDKKLITVSEDKKARIFYSTSDNIAVELCKKNSLKFTQAEWEKVTGLDNNNGGNPVPVICK